MGTDGQRRRIDPTAGNGLARLIEQTIHRNWDRCAVSQPRILIKEVFGAIDVHRIDVKAGERHLKPGLAGRGEFGRRAASNQELVNDDRTGNG